MANFYLKQNDLLPAIESVVVDANGAFNLAGCTVKFHMCDASGNVKIDATAVIVDAANGIVQYGWTGTDTDTAGIFQATWKVTASGPKQITFPNKGSISIEIGADC